MPSPFARPGSRAGTCTTPTSDGGMLPKASNPFTRPNSRAGFAPPEPTSPQPSVSSTSDNRLQEDVNTSVSWDLVDTDTDAEVANINTRQNNAVDLNNEINTLYNQDFFVADTTGRRLSKVADKSNYSSLLPNGNAALQLRLPDLLIYVVRRRGRLAPRQPLSVCSLLPAYGGNRHLQPLGNLGHRLRRPRWID